MNTDKHKTQTKSSSHRFLDNLKIHNWVKLTIRKIFGAICREKKEQSNESAKNLVGYLKKILI